jgi:hypothetical protein
MSALLWPRAGAWASLYRIGGVPGILFVLFGLAALALYAVTPPPVSGGEATLRFIADHKASSIVQQILGPLSRQRAPGLRLIESVRAHRRIESETGWAPVSSPTRMR